VRTRSKITSQVVCTKILIQGEIKVKKKSKIITLLAIVVLLLSACSGGNGESGGNNETKETANASKPVEIVYAYPVFGTIPPDMQLIEDEINKISIKEINVKAKLLPISGGSWEQQVNLMISGGEKLDLMSTWLLRSN
jgi:putative aldouronate transport system substrate-binding protein